jgi:hypothetical protein
MQFRKLATLFLLSVSAAIMADSTAFTFDSATARGGTLTTLAKGRSVARLVVVNNKDITVTALGAEVRDGTEGPTTVGIYDAVTAQLMAVTTVSPTDTQIGLYYFKSISPVVLTKNTSYYVASYIPAGGKFYLNTSAPTVDKALTDQASTWVASTELVQPAGNISPSSTYTANFRFDASPTISPVSGLPASILPSYRGRWGVNPTSSLNTTSISATVTDSANIPLVGVPVTFELLADTTVSGHAHSGLIFPWLKTQDDSARALSEGVGAAAKGGSVQASITVNTDANGVATVPFNAPEVAGTYQVRAVTPNQTNTSNWTSVDVKVPDLIAIPTSPSGSYLSVSGSDVHNGGFGTTELADRIETAAQEFVLLQKDPASGLPGLLQQLSETGYTGKFRAAAIPMRIGDASLKWGGLYDLRDDFSTALGHTLHRDGKEIDVYVSPMLQSVFEGRILDPNRILISDVDVDPAATPEAQTLIRQANLLRARLLVQALLASGFEISNEGKKDGLRLKLHCRLASE